MNNFYKQMLNIKETLKLAGAKLGKNIFIGHEVFFELENAPLIMIEDNVVISAFCKFILHDSSLNNTLGSPIKYAPIRLKRNCYIGLDSIIMPGSIIGENTIVGAGSLVKGTLKSNSVYIGRPVKYYCSIQELNNKWKRDKNAYYIETPKWHKRDENEEKK